MHSRIYAVRLISGNDLTKEIPEKTFELVSESEVVEHLVPYTADYVSAMEHEYWFDEAKWVCGCYNSCLTLEKDKDNIVINVDIEKATKFLGEQLVELNSLVSQLTPEKFMNSWDDTIYRINEILDERFGFRFLVMLGKDMYFDHYNFLDLLKLLIKYSKTKVAKLRIENVFDYHF